MYYVKPTYPPQTTVSLSIIAVLYYDGLECNTTGTVVVMTSQTLKSVLVFRFRSFQVFLVLCYQIMAISTTPCVFSKQCRTQRTNPNK